MHVLVHGTGYFDADRTGLAAGYCMSGVTTMLTGLVTGLVDSGATVSLVCPELASDHPPLVLHRRLTAYGYDARFADLFERGGRFDRRLARQWYAERADDRANPVYREIERHLSELQERIRPDVINVHNLNAAVAWLRLARHRPLTAPLVVTIHDIGRRQARFLAAHADHIARVVCVSASVATRLRAVGVPAGLLTVVAAGIDLARFGDHEAAGLRWQGLRQRLGVHDGFDLVGLVPTRRVPEKGIRQAIDAFRSYCDSASVSGVLLLSGSSMGLRAYEQMLADQVEGAPTTDRAVVRLLPDLPYADMPALYHGADVTLTLSMNAEGLGLANLEAMASRHSRVVTSGTGGAAGYVRDGRNALRCDPLDEASVVRAIGAAHHAPAALLDEAARTSRGFQVQPMVAGYREVFAAVRRGCGPTPH